MKTTPMLVTALLASSCALAAPASIVPSDLPEAVQRVLPVLRADAARRTGASADALQIVAWDEGQWSDGSMGCAEPGRIYTQALVPGWRIVLAVPDRAAQHYHGSRHGAWVWCAAGRSRPPAPGAQRM